MKKILILPILGLLLTCLNSCQKDDRLKGIADAPVVYAVQASQLTYPISVKLIGDVQSYVFSAGYGGLKTPGADVPVVFAVDSAALSAYNTTLTAGGAKAYLPLPAANYTIPSLSATIPANGVLTDPLSLKINAVGLNSNSKYALALTLNSAGNFTINSKVKTILFTIERLDNIYAGAYNSKGIRQNYDALGNASGAPSVFNFIKNLSTVSKDTSAVDAVANLGANRPNTLFKLAVDASTNKVSISGYLDDPANPITNEPGKTSTYDPASKTFYLYYRYTLTTSGGIYRAMADTLTRQ